MHRVHISREWNGNLYQQECAHIALRSLVRCDFHLKHLVMQIIHPRITGNKRIACPPGHGTKPFRLDFFNNQFQPRQFPPGPASDSNYVLSCISISRLLLPRKPSNNNSTTARRGSGDICLPSPGHAVNPSGRKNRGATMLPTSGWN